MIEGSNNEDIVDCVRPFTLFLGVVDEDVLLLADGAFARITSSVSASFVDRAEKNSQEHKSNSHSKT